MTGRRAVPARDAPPDSGRCFACGVSPAAHVRARRVRYCCACAHGDRPPRGIDPTRVRVYGLDLDEYADPVEVIDAWVETYLPPDERTGP